MGSLLATVAKGLALSVAFIFVSFILVVSFAGEREILRCEGVIEARNGEREGPAHLFLELGLYRFWVFWADSDGWVMAELPHEWMDYFPKVRRLGHTLAISGNDKLGGTYSTLSGAISLSVGPGDREFIGLCTRVSEG